MQLDCELRDRGPWDVEVQIYCDREFLYGRRWPIRALALKEADEQKTAYLRRVACSSCHADSIAEENMRVKVPTAVVEALLEKTKSELREMAIPVDFEDLIGRGILRAERKDNAKDPWYILLKHDELPKHAWQQVKTHAVATVNGKRVEKLQFRDTTKKARALLGKYFK